MKKFLGGSICLLSFVLSGCATSVPKETVSIPKAAVETKPSARIIGYTIEEMSNSHGCPQKLAATDDEKEMMTWAASCVRTAQWKQVEELGNRIAIRRPNSPWGAYFLSLSAERAKDLPRARWMAELAVKNAPNEGMTLYQLGRVQWAMDERDAAYVNLQKAAEKNPSLVEAHVFLGQMELIADRNSEAGHDFMKAFEHDSKHFGALMGLAEVGFRNKKWTDVEKYLRLAIQVQPRSLQARLRLAESQELLAKNNSDALQTYLEIQKLEKQHKLDAQAPLSIPGKVQTLQSNLAEELKKKLSADRQPSDERKVSK